jgi:hypothetical protein
MSWLKRMFSPAPAAPIAPQPQPQGQMRMTLEERMAFRRKMAVEAVRGVLAAHGLPSAGYRMYVTPVDPRGHRYAVMLELRPLPDIRCIDSLGEWQSMESEIVQTAAKRYRVGVEGVYWRMNQLLAAAARPHESEHVPDSEWATLSATTPIAAQSPPMASPTAPPVAQSAAADAGFLPKPSVSSANAAASSPKRQSKGEDGFPDTLLEDRPDAFEGVTPEELFAFEEAIRQGQSPKQPVRVGHRSYQTDYVPLD